MKNKIILLFFLIITTYIYSADASIALINIKSDNMNFKLSRWLEDKIYKEYINENNYLFFKQRELINDILTRNKIIINEIVFNNINASYLSQLLNTEIIIFISVYTTDNNYIEIKAYNSKDNKLILHINYLFSDKKELLRIGIQNIKSVIDSISSKNSEIDFYSYIGSIENKKHKKMFKKVLGSFPNEKINMESFYTYYKTRLNLSILSLTFGIGVISLAIPLLYILPRYLENTINSPYPLTISLSVVGIFVNLSGIILFINGLVKTIKYGSYKSILNLYLKKYSNINKTNDGLVFYF